MWLNVVGYSTFASPVDINSSLDVDGQTDLDLLNVAESANILGGCLLYTSPRPRD